MIGLAFEIFGIVALASGLCWLTMACHVKRSCNAKCEGFSITADNPTEALRCKVCCFLGLGFIGAGAVMTISVLLGLVS